MRTRNNRKLSDKRGSILLMVLVLILVMSFMLTRFVERTHAEIQGEGYYVERARLRLHAWSMMEVAVATLADVKAINGALHAPAQGWGDILDYTKVELPEGLNVQFEFIDESAKLNINNLDEGSLLLLFDQMGFDLDISQTLTNTFLDWIDSDDQARIDGAESFEYSIDGMDMSPSNQPIESLEELYSVIGFRELFFDENGLPNDLFQQLSEVVTYHEVSRLNANSANQLALMSLAGLGEDQAYIIQEHLSGLDGELGTEDDNYFADNQELQDVVGDLPRGIPLNSQISVLTIKVRVQESSNAFTLIGTINTQTQAAGSSNNNLQYPFVFLEVREEPGLNNAQPS